VVSCLAASDAQMRTARGEEVLDLNPSVVGQQWNDANAMSGNDVGLWEQLFVVGC
jgi:hypothetical protein